MNTSPSSMRLIRWNVLCCLQCPALLFGKLTLFNLRRLALFNFLNKTQTQTPGYPHGDGDCAPPGCDVGKNLPIGAYLFNPAAANHSINNQTFTEWFIDEYLFGPNGGANPNISGFFFDDQFNPNGATESEGTLPNLGLTPAQGGLLRVQS